MAESPKVGSSVLVGVIVFIAASAWVATEVLSTNPYSPGHVPEPRAALIGDRVATGSTMIPANASLSPNEVVVTHYPTAAAAPIEAATPRKTVAPNESPTPRPVRAAEKRKPAAKPLPAAKPQVSQTTVAIRNAPPQPVASTSRAAIVIEARRIPQDEHIRRQVIQRLATNPRLDGQIAVESKDAVVRLTGWTRTAGQARHAERDARSVPSVRHVQNEIRPRIGGAV